MEAVRAASHSTLSVTIPSELNGSDGGLDPASGPVDLAQLDPAQGQRVSQGSDGGSARSLPRAARNSPSNQRRE